MSPKLINVMWAIICFFLKVNKTKVYPISNGA